MPNDTKTPPVGAESDTFTIGPFNKPLEYWMGDVISCFIAKAEEQGYAVLRMDTADGQPDKGTITVRAVAPRRPAWAR